MLTKSLSRAVRYKKNRDGLGMHEMLLKMIQQTSIADIISEAFETTFVVIF